MGGWGRGVSTERGGRFSGLNATVSRAPFPIPVRVSKIYFRLDAISNPSKSISRNTVIWKSRIRMKPILNGSRDDTDL
jgi:hypothetical protein